MSKFFHSRSAYKIEVTNVETGEKTTYHGMMKEHSIDMHREREVHFPPGGGSVTDHSGPNTAREITLKFVDYGIKAAQPKFKGMDAKIKEIMEKEEEML